MKSNVCKIENGIKDLAAILKESEKVAVYNELNHKQTMQLRLLCEEVDGMLPKIIDDFEGDFWIEFEDGVCKVNVSIRFAEFSKDKKKELLDLSKDKKNASVKGIGSKISSAIEEFFLSEENMQAVAMSSAFYSTAVGCGVEYPYYFSLDQYKANVKKEENAEDFDELEKSVIASVADDVIVGVRGVQADITIVKKFA